MDYKLGIFLAFALILYYFYSKIDQLNDDIKTITGKMEQIEQFTSSRQLEYFNQRKQINPNEQQIPPRENTQHMNLRNKQIVSNEQIVPTEQNHPVSNIKPSVDVSRKQSPPPENQSNMKRPSILKRSGSSKQELVNKDMKNIDDVKKEENQIPITIPDKQNISLFKESEIIQNDTADDTADDSESSIDDKDFSYEEFSKNVIEVYSNESTTNKLQEKLPTNEKTVVTEKIIEENDSDNVNTDDMVDGLIQDELDVASMSKRIDKQLRKKAQSEKTDETEQEVTEKDNSENNEQENTTESVKSDDNKKQDSNNDSSDNDSSDDNKPEESTKKQVKEPIKIKLSDLTKLKLQELKNKCKQNKIDLYKRVGNVKRLKNKTELCNDLIKLENII